MARAKKALSNKVIPKETAARAAKVDLASLAGARPALAATAAPAAAPDDHAAALQSARDQGYQEGLAAGRRQAEGGGEAERAELKALIGGINELLKDFEQDLANDVLTISLELAKLIVRTALRVRPELVVAVVREALGVLPGVSDQTVLYLHPADAVLMREVAASDPQFKELKWTIAKDPQLERGGCRLSAPTSEVDASLETRWRRVIAAIGRDDAWVDISH